MRLVVFILLLCFSTVLLSQSNTNYWSYQYGDKGLLLNGAVIGSVDDETAIFYNPGAMANNKETGVAFAFVTPSGSLNQTKDLIGNGDDIKIRNVGFAPGLVSAAVNLYDKRLIGGFTSFTRYRSNIGFEKKITGDVMGSPDKFFAGEVNFRNKVSERWLGFGLSYAFGKKFSVGLTKFVTLRTDRLNYGFQRQILSKQNSEELSEAWLYDFNYAILSTGGLLSKLGLSWQPNRFKIGLTLTTNTYGTISSKARYAYSDIKIKNSNNTAYTDRQSVKVNNNNKTPWSLGLGVTYRFSKDYSIHFSTEYFARIKPYYAINHTVEPYLGSEASPVTTTVKIGKKRIMNFAIGFEDSLNKKYKLFYGMRTDFNPSEVFLIDEDADFLGTAPDMLHISFGTIYEYDKSRLSYGADFGYGSKKDGPQLLDIANITRGNIFEKPRAEKTDVHSYELTLFITYSL